MPLAFRAGSEKKGRVHIFWQKRIRPGDTTTPWWFPAKTDAGSIRQDRLVLPIPPQLHWSDPMPVLTPAQQEVPVAKLPRAPKSAKAVEPAKPRRPRTHMQTGPLPSMPAPGVPTEAMPAAKPAVIKTLRPKRKADPKLIAAARELRDRWLEKITREPSLLAPAGKYDLARQLPDEHEALPVVEVKALPEAA